MPCAPTKAAWVLALEIPSGLGSEVCVQADATAAMGDVLTIAAALLAQGKSPLQSAKLAAWLCGHAAELALRDGPASQESLTASDIITHLGPAFTNLRAGAI